MIEKRIWQCDNECIPWEMPCHGKCLSDQYGIITHSHTGQFNNKSEITAHETYWKCPYDERCVSSFKFCSSFNFPNENVAALISCPDNAEVSRNVCEQPLKYNISLNCNERGLFKCTGHRSEQCITKANRCDGFLQCIDRSDESNCPGELQLDYNLFKHCLTEEREDGFKCNYENCVPIKYWCSKSHIILPEYNSLTNLCPQLLLTFNNERLCQNHSFWQNKPCPSNSQGRCKGNYPGECILGNENDDIKSSFADEPCYDPYSLNICRDIASIETFSVMAMFIAQIILMKMN